MRGTEHRTDNRPDRALLPLLGTAVAGCSCCSPAGNAGVSRASVGTNHAGIPAEADTAVGQFSGSGVEAQS
ncbi:hypothetical protein ACS5PJ_17875 [Pseudarthrobacter sp. YS3]|uniref:hypothetical protein n=1 Tax=Pseudarthrobacter sp. YS3 TaxID=3453718 RepID=UPI003EED79AA